MDLVCRRRFLLADLLLLMTLAVAQYHLATHAASSRDRANVTLVGNVSRPRSIHLLVLAPFPVPLRKIEVYDAGYSLLAGVDVALEIINARDDILPGYRLNYVTGNSACTDGTTAAAEFTGGTFLGGHAVAGVVGPACSGAAIAVAPLVARREVNLVQITAATSPQLANEDYSNTYMVISTARVYVEIFRTLMELVNWNRVGAFFEMNRFYFYSTYGTFRQKIPASNITFSSGVDYFFLPVSHSIAREYQTRVLFVFAGGEISQRLMCLAFHEEMTYPHYQWIFHEKRIEHFNEISFTAHNRHYHCSQEQMHRAIKGAIFARYSIERSPLDKAEFIGGLNYSEYLKRYNEKLADGNEFDGYANAYYDAVWAMALSLNKSLDWFEAHNLSLSDYHYGETDATEEIRRRLLEVDFTGITGSINYNRLSREAQTRVELYQVFTNNSTSPNAPMYIEKKIADNFNISLALQHGVFISGTFERLVDIYHFERVFAVVAFVLCFLLAILSVVLLAVTITSRHESVKASSPRLAILIFSGCCLILVGMAASASGPAFVTSYTGLSPLVHSIVCMAPWWCFSMSYSLIFGTLCGKTWRIYCIFMSFKKEHRFLSDHFIVFFVSGLLLLDVAVNIIFNITNPCHLDGLEERFDDNDRILVTVGCACQDSIQLLVLFLFLIVSKGLLLFVLLSLAILIRHIKQSKFKNTTEIAVMTFCILFIYGIGLPLLVSGVMHRVGTFSLLFILISSPVPLCHIFIFLPPILPLIKEKIKIRQLFTLHKCRSSQT